MPTEKGTVFAILFFAAALLCCLNPEVLPLRDWFNQVLETLFSGFR